MSETPNKYAFLDSNGKAWEVPPITGRTFLKLRKLPDAPQVAGEEYLAFVAVDAATLMGAMEILTGVNIDDLGGDGMAGAKAAWLARVADFFQGRIPPESMTAMVNAMDLARALAPLLKALGQEGQPIHEAPALIGGSPS